MECFQQSPHAGVRAISTLTMKQTAGSFSRIQETPESSQKQEQEPMVKNKLCLRGNRELRSPDEVILCQKKGQSLMLV